MAEQGRKFDGVFDEEAALVAVSYATFISDASSSLNATTSRYKRTQYHCQIAKNLRHVPDTAYSKIFSDHLFGFARLDDDDIPDLIHGYTAEPINVTNIDWPIDYAVTLSTGTELDTTLPNLLARKILVQDFNLDGRDDVAFLNAGRHKPPMPGHANRILLSQPDGFAFSDLPGGARISHGGAAGDLDGDGDIDIVVANGQQRNVQLLVNRGNGSFSARSLYPNFPGMVYTAEIWDVDQDGHLDVVYGTGSDTGKDTSNGLFVAWGKRSPKDRPWFSRLQNYRFDSLADRVVLDFAFADFTNDGMTDMAVLDTRIEEEAYRGWGISMIAFHPDRSTSITPMHDYDPGKNHKWTAWIDDCDIDHDSTPDLVSIRIGRSELEFVHPANLFVWQNDRNWEWERRGTSSALLHNRSSNKDRDHCHELIFGENWKENVAIWVEKAGNNRFNKFLCNRLFADR